MRIYVKIIFFLLLGLVNNVAFGQKSPIYDIEKKLMLGNKSALKELASYLDSDKQIIEYLGYHIIETTENLVARRFIEENSLFTLEELNPEKLSKKVFLDFLNKNFKKIKFSNLADAFIITSLEKRPLQIEFRALTESQLHDLNSKKIELENKEWLKNSKIDSLLKNRDSKCLLLIASELYKIRYRFNVYQNNKKEYIDLLQLLSNVEIGVENDKKMISWHIEKDFRPDSSLNLLIYFSKNYKDFKWNSKKNYFENSKIQPKPIYKELSLFKLLNHKNDSIAKDAFIQLTTSDYEKVIKLAKEYENANIDNSYAIQTFPYRFLKQLVMLVSVFKKNEISFTTNFKIKNYVEKLTTDLSFKDRRNLEDEIINQISLDDISSFEYWALINEKSWHCTYSAGRILDIFYSNHFKEILNNPKQLDLYLKKSFLFDNLGIIGVCNDYLKKFTDLNEFGIEKLRELKTTDDDVKLQIEKAILICKLSIKLPNDDDKINNANEDYNVTDIKGNIIKIRKIINKEKMEDSLTAFLSKISYDQIGQAIEEIENIEFSKYKWKKYSFLERDFGFFFYKNFDTITTRREFIIDYNKFSEFDFYKNMLSMAGTNYFKQDAKLDYDKIYDALKYNVVNAFVGGGGGKQDNEIYAVIKLLEITHKNTLGYPKKLCNSNGIYGCDSQDRANYWMQYFDKNKLLNGEQNKIVSFHYN